jgi:hypothetical protein
VRLATALTAELWRSADLDHNSFVSFKNRAECKVKLLNDYYCSRTRKRRGYYHKDRTWTSPQRKDLDSTNTTGPGQDRTWKTSVLEKQQALDNNKTCTTQPRGPTQDLRNNRMNQN